MYTDGYPCHAVRLHTLDDDSMCTPLHPGLPVLSPGLGDSHVGAVEARLSVTRS
jgi:hypothetical protein